MAGASLFTLLDDIASLLDDIAVLSKAAVQKTSGVLGDDLALNAQQVTGIAPHRELPVVYRVGVGSAWNKAILVPGALLISWILPQAILPLLMIGGAYLCFEGVEKLLHRYLHPHATEEQHAQRLAAVADGSTDMVAFEQLRIRGAIRTDFVLSAEIIVITLGMLAQVTFLQRVLVLLVVSVVMTLGVYGLVAVIVKLDDMGLYLATRRQAAVRTLGRGMVGLAPYLLRFLSVAGTLAMFLVGGGILVHGVPALHHAVEHALEPLHHLSTGGAWLHFFLEHLAHAAVGVLAGGVLVAAYLLWNRLRATAIKPVARQA
jgi:uncharacterized protein